MKKTGTAKPRLLLLVLPAVPAVLILAFLLYTADYYRADETAVQALTSDKVRVEETDYGWLFDGPSEDAALIFYPGAKVEETAYAPLLHCLAAEGPDVCLVKMPFRLAFLGARAADDIMARGGYASWYIGGHSLGGAIAADYAADRELDGVILLAAYPSKALDEPMLILYGSEDGVVNRERLKAAERYGAVDEVRIEGGNHAFFGDYGPQRGDGDATLTPARQQALAREAVETWLARQPGGKDREENR